MRAVLALFIAAPLFAATPVDIPRGPMTDFSLIWYNDSHQFLHDQDDHLTNQFNINFKVGGGFSIGLEHAMMTKLWEERFIPDDPIWQPLYRPYRVGIRIDRISFSVGYAIIDKPDRLVDVGLGYSKYGNMGGQTIQNPWHEIVSEAKVHVDYAEPPEDDIFAYTRLYWLEPKSRFYAKVNGIVTYHGEVSFDTEIGISRGRGTLGALYQTRLNGPDNVVIDYVQDWEQDWFVLAEFNINHVRLTWLLNDRIAAGIVTVTF